MESRLPFVEGASARTRELSPQSLVLPGLVVVLLGVGFGGLTLGLTGLSNAVVLMSAALVAGALMTFRSLLQRAAGDDFDHAVHAGLLGELVDMNRRATVLTDVRGRRIAANDGFAQLTGDPDLGLSDVLAGGRSFATFNRLVNQIRRHGEGEGIFRSVLETQPQLTLNGRRLGRYILWEVRGEGAQGRLRREAEFINGWAAPFLEALVCGVAIEDEHGVLQSVNPVLANWLGVDPGAALPEKLPLRDEDSFLDVGDDRRVDVSVIRVPLEARGAEYPVGSVCFVRRIGASRASEPGEDGPGLIDSVLDAAPVAIALLDCSGVVLEHNRTLLRYVHAELKPGAPLAPLLHADEQVAFLEAVRLACQGTPPVSPLDVRFVGGRERSGQMFFSSVQFDGEPRAILYLSDKTQEKQLERQFVQAQKMQAVGQLAGGVAHDFNNLLTAIIGFCDLLLLRHDTGDRSFSDLIQIKQNANRAANLVRQLLAFSRQQVVKPEILEISDVLAELSNLVRRLIGEHIELVVTHGRDLPKIKSDQGQLEQVLINLCVNARDAMPNGGKLTIATRVVEADDPVFEEFEVMARGRYIQIEVQDTGSGIPLDIQEKIFEPFFTTKGVGEGTGLGLATVYGIVKQTGGYVFFRSKAGEGTSFLIFLKALDEAEARAEVAPFIDEAARDLSGQGTIMLVEDEDSVRIFAERALASKGYKVIDCAAADLALEAFETVGDELTLMITDVVMPDMDGPALVDIVRERRPDLPVIFVSGYAEDLLANKLENPLNHFVAKPFSLKALAEKVKEVLGEA